MSVDVSPDGQTLVFDLLGDIYSLPIGGGEATSITTGRAWDHAPRFSRNGKSVYFVSDREGFKNIWGLTLSDNSLRQITKSHSDIMGTPNWSRDGTQLIVGVADSDINIATTEVVLHAVDPNNGAMMPLERTDGPWFNVGTRANLRERLTAYSGVQANNGQVYFSEGRYDEKSSKTFVKLYRIYPDTPKRIIVTPPEAVYSEYKPQLSHDGRLLAYFRQYPDRRTEIRIRNQKTGQDEMLIELANADDASYNASYDSRANYAFTPDDRSIVFGHDGKIHRVHVTDGSSEIIPFEVKVERTVWTRAEPATQHINGIGEATVIRWPSVSPDGQTVVFAAIGYVWVMDMDTGNIRRLSSANDFEYMPALSPDGSSVAYISFAQSGNGYGAGRLVVADVRDGAQRDVLTAPNVTYLLPKWSRDGSKIALIREVRGESHTEAAFGWASATNGEFHEVASAPTSDEYLGWRLYSRFVGFDTSGSNLLFSYRRSRFETVLASARLDGDGLRTIAVGGADVGGIAPAADLRSLALTRRDRSVWVVPFDTALKHNHVSTASSDAHRVSDGGGYYVDWSGLQHITFGFGQNVYRYPLDKGELESFRIQLAYEKPEAARPIAFTDARLITISNGHSAGPVIESGTIVVDGQRIAAVGPVDDVVIPSDAVVINATGKTIIPGLVDVHYHRIGGRSLSAFALPNPDFSDRSAIEYGVTTAWEPGGPADDGVAATVDLQRAGRILGPRWSHAAFGAVGYPWEYLTSYSAAAAAVDQHYELGVAVLKEYDTRTRQQRQWLAAAAREKGLGIVSHIVSFDGMMTRIVDGYTGGDHPYIPVPFFKDVQEMLRQTGYIWTPNIGLAYGSAATGPGPISYFCQAVSQKVDRKPRNNPGVIDSSWICRGERGSLIPTGPFDIHRVGRIAKQAASAATYGIHIGVSAHNMPGSNLHREMWYLWKGGLPVEYVLRATTIGNAEKLGLQEEIGSLEQGKIADFLVLDENPLDGILNTLALKYTVQGGVVYDSATGQKVDWTGIL